MTDDLTLAVATDLGAIITLHHGLIVQAWHKANARDMPGGLAMVALGPVANLAAIEGRRETLERLWWEDETGEVARPEYIDENDDPWEPPLQTLRWWTEEYRQRNGCEVEKWTVATEAQWLIDNLAWVAANEPHFGDLARDVAAARRRLEDVLQDGERDKRGLVKCTRCGEPLVRDADPRRDCGCPPRRPHAPHGRCDCRRVITTKLLPTLKPGEYEHVHVAIENTDEHIHERPDLCCLACHEGIEERHAGHKQGGLADTWRCSDDDCWKTYTADEYKTLVAKDARDNAKALAAQELVKRFNGLTVGQIRMWAHRDLIHKRGRDELNRMTYDVSDVQRLAG